MENFGDRCNSVDSVAPDLLDARRIPQGCCVMVLENFPSPDVICTEKDVADAFQGAAQDYPARRPVGF